MTYRKRSTGQSRSKLKYMADFETTTDEHDCRVWGWGLSIIGSDKVETGTTLDDFMRRIDDKDAIIYFHNLKFDGHFIIDWLLKHGYVHVEGKVTGDSQFSTLMSDMGKFYSMRIQTHMGCKIELRDSLKKLPMPVERIATSFNLPVLKGSIDYDAPRAKTHKLTSEEKEYIVNDILIPSKALATQFDSGMTKLTVGSDSLAEYKRIVGDKFFSRHFPVLSHAMDAEIRRAYRGGYTYAAPQFQGRVVRGGKVYDVNSLYPAVMYNKPIPYGEPQYCAGKVEPTESHPLTIFAVTVTAKLKPDHLPCIQIKGNSMFQPTVYLEDIPNPTTLMVTNVDFDLYMDHYDIEVYEWGGGWRFRAATYLFTKYIDKWSQIKAESSGGLREIAKLHLNSLYGKLASNPSVASKFPYLRDDGRVAWRRGPDELRDPVYTPAGVFITSYARDLTIRAAQSYYPVFAYADTDSLHLLIDDEPEMLDIHPHRMGAWKHEYDFEAAFYIRAKAYLERHADGTYTNRIAGLPEPVSSKLTFDDVRDGAVIEGKLTPKIVPGGVVLKDTPFELKL